MRIRISTTTDPKDFEKVIPNFIYNRFDLFCDKDEFVAVKITNGFSSKIVQYRILSDRIELGLWLTPITVEELEKLVGYISDRHKNINLITYNNGVLEYGTARTHNHFRIVFPETVEEMENRISGKSRAKAKKKIRRAEEVYGEMSIIEYDRASIPTEVVEAFFRFKLETRGRTYDMTADEYLDRYHVSHAYVLMLGSTVGAIRFSCEQCPVVYGENFTFNPELKDYSLGRYIFMYHLNRMVEKKHTELYFAGGDFEYKTHYGSIEETLYDCKIRINRETVPKAPAKKPSKKNYLRNAKNYIVGHMPSGIQKFLVRAKAKLHSLLGR